MLFALFKLGKVLFAACYTEFQYFKCTVLALNVGESIDVGFLFQLIQGGTNAAKQHFAAHKDESGAAMLEYMYVVLG